MRLTCEEIRQLCKWLFIKFSKRETGNYRKIAMVNILKVFLNFYHQLTLLFSNSNLYILKDDHKN